MTEQYLRKLIHATNSGTTRSGDAERLSLGTNKMFNKQSDNESKCSYSYGVRGTTASGHPPVRRKHHALRIAIDRSIDRGRMAFALCRVLHRMSGPLLRGIPPCLVFEWR